MIRLAVVNMAWQLGHNDLLIDQVCKGADVVLACEALANGGKAPEHLAHLLPDGWRTNQDTSSAALAGSAVIWRTAVMGNHHTGDDPIAASRKGIGVRPRYLMPALLTYKPTGDTRRYVPFHAPLRLTGRQPEFYRSLARYLAVHPHAVAAGDGNRPHRWVTGQTGRPSIGLEVMSVLLPHDLAHGLPRYERTPYSDHPIIRLHLDPRRRR
jgi:hypothetical protein